MFNSKRALGVGRRWISPLKPAPSASSLQSQDTMELQLIEKGFTDVQIDDGLSPSSYRPLHPKPSYATTKPTTQTGVSKGWKSGALYIATWTWAVFVINFIVTIWGSTRSIGGGVLFEGDCSHANKLDAGLHILINALSTILLSGSNYCMQCLSAPTRREVDRAHAKGKWLHIGMPSLRNMPYINRRRALVWCLLGLTSMPLHLFYNSAVFSSISSNSYYAFSVSEAFVNNTQCTNCTVPQYGTGSIYDQGYYGETLAEIQNYNSFNFTSLLRYLQKAAHLGELERLEAADCIKEYSTLLQFNRRHVLLVGKNITAPLPSNTTFLPGSQVYWGGSFDANSVQDDVESAYGWMCSAMNSGFQCLQDISQIKQNPENWRVGLNSTYSFPVDYCLSEKATPHCKVRFDTTIAAVVTVLNFFKASLMLYIAYKLPFEPLVTVGDALASFLSKPDLTTKDMCLFSRRDFRKTPSNVEPRKWTDKKFRWKDATSRTHRATVFLLIVAALSVVGSLLGLGIDNLSYNDTSTSVSSLASLGYGTVDPRTAINSIPDNIYGAAFIANSPQVILSLIYFSYNALLTAMLLGYEWTTYAQKRKGLRVSSKGEGEQRSKYFLQLPYRFGIPLLCLSGLLHWFVSQSIFVVAIDFWDPINTTNNQPASSNTSNVKTCGYSPIAIISVIALGGAMLIAITAAGFIPYKGGMTMAGSCSMAMSAACHPSSEKEINQASGDSDGEDFSAALEKVQWGVMTTIDTDVGHCGFSAGNVSAPVKDRLYAGPS